MATHNHKIIHTERNRPDRTLGGVHIPESWAPEEREALMERERFAADLREGEKKEREERARARREGRSTRGKYRARPPATPSPSAGPATCISRSGVYRYYHLADKDGVCVFCDLKPGKETEDWGLGAAGEE